MVVFCCGVANILARNCLSLVCSSTCEGKVGRRRAARAHVPHHSQRARGDASPLRALRAISPTASEVAARRWIGPRGGPKWPLARVPRHSQRARADATASGLSARSARLADDQRRWGDEEEEEDEGYEELRVRFGSAGGGRKTGGRMDHAGNNKCDHHDQRVSLWMRSVTTLTILVRAWDGMILACASICKAGGDGEAGQRRDGEAGRLAGKNAVSPAECCALGG